jgi:eukaryotic-like serine/threonine-protein kinase
VETLEKRKIGKYEITGILGRGGMGVVYRAEDKRIGRKVAIKTLTEGFSGQPEMLERFYREAQAGILQHPNIVIVYDLGDEDGVPFIVMEFVEGEPLDKIIASGRQITLIDKLGIIEQVCLGLGYAHQRGVVHRDIKPANVIVQPGGHAKIVDFGIARVQSSNKETGLTRTGNVIGTIHYIAPERLKGRPFDGRSDIFSTGVMLYLLLTGQLPFTGEDMTVLQKLVNEPHPPLHTLLATYPPALDGIVDRALAKDPDHRYATAEEFAADLHALGEELKKGQVAELFNDAERLTAEQQFGRAREVLLQLVRIDPQHTGARQLLGIVQQNLALLQRAEQIRQLIAEAEEAAASDRYAEALASLDQALQLAPNHEEAKSRLQSVKEKKQRYDELTTLMTQADSLRERGDWTGALKVAEKALQLGQQDTKVRALYTEISRQAKLAAQQNQIRELMGKARIEVSARRFTEAIEILREVSKLDPSLPEMESLHHTAVAGQEQERRRKLIDQIQAEIERCLAAEEYDRATELIDRAVEQLPSESSLLQLKTRVALLTRQFRVRQLVDATAAKAQAAFQQSPGEALLIVQKALQELPGEERLLALEDSLRQRLKAREKEEVRGRYLREAQDAINAGRFDKAVEILESYQLEFADATGVGELLEFARNELTQQRRRERCAQCIAEARSLMEQERFDQAVQLLGPACAETGDPVLARLLEEARAQQEEAERKTLALMARIGRLKEQGQLDEAIEILNGLPASSIAGTPQKALLEEIRSQHERLRAEKARKQTIADALVKAAKTAEQGQFQPALEALEGVRRAWGEAPELARAISEIEARRGRAANEAVGKAVENARAALLANDTPRALEELRKGAGLFEFAGPAQQADWRRLNTEASKAPTRRATGHVPVVGEVAEQAPKRKLLIPAVAGGVVVTAIVAVGVWFHLQGAKPVAQQQPTVHGPASPPPALPSTPTGTLLLKGNTDNVQVFVDGVLKGFTLADGSLKLPLDPGQHSIRLEKSGYTEIAPASVTISANNQSTLPFKLAQTAGIPPPEPVAFMTIQSTPGAAVSIDNAAQGQTDARGTLIVQVKPGARSLTINLSGYQPYNQTFNLKNGERENISAMLVAIPKPATPTPAAAPPVSALFSASATTIEQGQSTTLSWETANASEVSIDNGIGQVSASGQRQVTPSSNATFELVAKGNGGVQQRTINIVVEPKQVVAAPAPVPPPPSPQPVDQTALLQAVINNFNAALAAHDVGRMRSVWAGMTPQVEKKWQGFFKSLPKAKVSESCPAGSLNVSGDSATWSCTITTLIPGAPAQPQGVRFTLAKRNDAWVITDWR